jgi:hypothetical protein
MPKSRAKGNRHGIRRIAIDGHFLNEIQTSLHAPSGRSVVYTSAAPERHQAMEEVDSVTLKLPALTALQLFRDGVPPVDLQRGYEP